MPTPGRSPTRSFTRSCVSSLLEALEPPPGAEREDDQCQHSPHDDPGIDVAALGERCRDLVADHARARDAGKHADERAEEKVAQLDAKRTRHDAFDEEGRHRHQPYRHYREEALAAQALGDAL